MVDLNSPFAASAMTLASAATRPSAAGASIAVRPSQCRVRDSQNSAKAHTSSTSAGSPHCPFCAWTCGWPSLVRAAEASGDS